MRAHEVAELSAFVAIAEARSFRRAATRLNLRPSTLSHSLRALEERLGVTLLNRTTRTVALTQAGAALLAEVSPALARIEAAVEGVNDFRARPHGAVRVNVPRSAATQVLAPRFREFARDYPDVTLEVIVDNGFVDIVKEGYDAGIRLGESVDRDMTTVRVSGEVRAAVVASPDYWRGAPPPRLPRDLHEHRCINRRYKWGGALHRWVFARGSEQLSITVDGPLVLDSDDLMRRAALEGVGVAMLSEADVQTDLAEGRLVRALEDWCPAIPGFYLYYPRAGQTSASLRALIDTLAVAGSP